MRRHSACHFYLRYCLTARKRENEYRARTITRRLVWQCEARSRDHSPGIGENCSREMGKWEGIQRYGRSSRLSLLLRDLLCVRPVLVLTFGLVFQNETTSSHTHLELHLCLCWADSSLKKTNNPLFFGLTKKKFYNFIFLRLQNLTNYRTDSIIELCMLKKNKGRKEIYQLCT